MTENTTQADECLSRLTAELGTTSDEQQIFESLNGLEASNDFWFNEWMFTRPVFDNICEWTGNFNAFVKWIESCKSNKKFMKHLRSLCV